MSPLQSNTQQGPFTVLAGEDLTGKEAHLVVLTHDSGVAEVKLPGDVDEKPDYLVLEGGADTEEVTVVALDRSGNIRVKLDDC